VEHPGRALAGTRAKLKTYHGFKLVIFSSSLCDIHLFDDCTMVSVDTMVSASAVLIADTMVQWSCRGARDLLALNQPQITLESNDEHY
jgi:hypothetical protein